MATLPKPKLSESRLTSMQARASRVWRGESQPQVSMAEDILFLVAEVRDLRAKLAVRPKDEDRLFSEADKLFTETDSFFKPRASTKPKTEEPETTQQWFGSRLFTRFRDWMRSL